jgi:putative sigma-54 modulation protein
VKVNITGRHVEVTPALRSFTEEHMSKLEDFFKGVKGARVILSVEKYRHTCEINFKAGNHQFTAKETTKDMYASIERTVHALVQQTSKRKDKEHTLNTHAHKGRPVSLKSMPVKEEKAVSKKVVKVKAFASKPMSLEDALVDLENGKHGVLAYFNATSQTVHVVFTRPDGSVGLIEEP